MARHHELLSGEKIKPSSLNKREKKYIKSLENCVAECEKHDKEDYFYVYKQAMGPIKEGKGFTRTTLTALNESDYYKVVSDIVKRYWYKCFSEDENFEEYIRKEGLEEEYSIWKRTSKRF